MSKRHLPIVIAGAGPAGSTLAIRLRRLGLSVVLIERSRFPRQKLCGEFISPECLHHFDDLGVLDEMLAAGGARIDETVFFDSSGRSVAVPSRWFLSGAFALGLSRARMDQVLLDAARASGAEVLEETSVTGLIFDKRSVRGVRVRKPDGRVDEVPSALTIDATGRACVLSRLADKRFRRVNERRSRFVAFKVHLAGTRLPHGSCEIYSFRNGYAGLSFVEGGEANLCFLAKASLIKGGSDASDIFETLKRQNVRARTTLAEASKLHDWLSVSVPVFGLGDRSVVDGLCSVGDSAAFIDPFTGSGILMAIESAELMAQTIDRHGADQAGLGEAYYTAYRERFRSRLLVSGLIRKVAYKPMLSSAAVILLSASERLRSTLARSTRPPEILDRG